MPCENGQKTVRELSLLGSLVCLAATSVIRWRVEERERASPEIGNGFWWCEKTCHWTAIG